MKLKFEQLLIDTEHPEFFPADGAEDLVKAIAYDLPVSSNNVAVVTEIEIYGMAELLFIQAQLNEIP